jgi:hypothetical protein
MSAPTTPAALPALEFEVPLVNPAPGGLYTVTSWTEVTGPSRFLGEGVRIHVRNFGGEQSTGVWESEWCVDPGDQLKSGERPDNLDPFAPITCWAVDSCDLTAPSQQEVRERAAQNLRLLEQTAVEREFSERLLIEGIPNHAGVLSLTDAVAHLEKCFAETNTVGLIHASAGLAAYATKDNLVTRSGAALKTPMGHTWVFGGGYVDGLVASAGESVIVGTSPIYGFRNPVEVREAIDATHNTFIAIAERSLSLGFEHCVGAATIINTTPSPNADASR